MGVSRAPYMEASPQVGNVRVREYAVSVLYVLFWAKMNNIVVTALTKYIMQDKFYLQDGYTKDPYAIYIYVNYNMKSTIGYMRHLIYDYSLL